MAYYLVTQFEMITDMELNFPKKPNAAQPFNNFTAFYGIRKLLPLSQDSNTGPYPLK
jgi:hypothetical protein